MARTSVRFDFANGAYDFALPGEKIMEIEDERKIGLGEIYARTIAGSYPGDNAMDPANSVANGAPDLGRFFFADMLHVIHKGLLAGGGGEVLGKPVTMTPGLADRLIKDYVLNAGDTRMTMMAIWKLARSILFVLAEGYSPPKKDEPGESPATPQSD
jgi:hypothetical protein